jgi:hypothetical protein
MVSEVTSIDLEPYQGELECLPKFATFHVAKNRKKFGSNPLIVEVAYKTEYFG